MILPRRLELIRAAGWTVDEYVDQVAREHGCTCPVVIVASEPRRRGRPVGGFLHAAPCALVAESHTSGFRPFDPEACSRVDDFLGETIHRAVRAV